MKASSHVWNFSTVGGVKRVNLESGADLVHLGELDPKLWTALSCPVDGLEMDRKTLELIDTDHDGQIRVPEILAAVRWITSVIKNPDDILKGESGLPLSAILDQSEPGISLLSSAKTILKNLGKPDQETISVHETSDTQKIFEGTRFNGDGIITEDTAGDPVTAGLIRDIIACTGSVTDRSGKQGMNREMLGRFTVHCASYRAWREKADAEKTTILPFGANTETAYEDFSALRPKIDDFFIRCRLAEFDPLSADILNRTIRGSEEISAKNLTACMDEIAGYPIARIEAGKPFPLTAGINPAWEKTVNRLKKNAADVIFPGKDSLTENEWTALKERFAPYAAWIKEKAGTEVESLGFARICDILDKKLPDQLTALIDQDLSMASQAEGIFSVDKLVRFYRDIKTVLNNFVTFYDFYSPDVKALFEAGTLYIDQRSCDLCIRVRDMAKHATMVSYSGMFLIYCDCVLRKTGEKMTIVAGLTHGDIDNLVVGRNGVFYDRTGRDWDATVIKLIENPISIRQAFWTPYRKVSRMIEKQINKVAAAQDEKVTATASKTIEEAPAKITPGAPVKPPAQPFDIGKFVGIFAAIGLAIGAIGTALASILTGFLGLVWWKMPIALLGLILAISGPSMIIASLKLRKRNLAPILDANGWAINARAVINIPFGNTLTHLAELPIGAKVNLKDPFMKKKRPLIPVLILLLLIAGAALYILWTYGYIQIPYMGESTLDTGHGGE